MSVRLNVLSLERLSDGTVIARVELPKGREYDIFKQAETLSISIADNTATPVTFPEPWPPPIAPEHFYPVDTTHTGFNNKIIKRS